MGTNYYRKDIITEDQIEKLIERLRNHEVTSISYTYGENNSQESLGNEIHLGKSSYGWQFLFDHNNWQYYTADRKSIEDFCNSGIIIDEYGRVISNNEFWDIVDSQKDGYTLETYYKDNPNEYTPYNSEIIKEGFRFDTDFC